MFASGYTLDSDLSSVGFSTIKNQFVVEPATISHLSGTINESGEFDVAVDISSVETGIPIRNSRLNDILFESLKYPKVKVMGKVDIANLKDGSYNMTLPANVTFFGKTKSIEFPVIILKSSDYLMVSSSSPVIVGLSDFGIPNTNLTKLAATVGGIHISDRVPVTITLSFKK
ncbi:YceI domain-containing protein [Vibrio aestuarianus]|nr:YceI domain-containing protein [Vibrio aestuarianus]